MKSNEERLQEILARSDTLSYVKPERIPNIDLYMDQVITFMDGHLVKTKRYPDDKVLTKIMTNDYTKNNLLPPPNKKKYSRQRILLLIFIYYFKNVLSFSDIEELFRPVTEVHSDEGEDLSLQDVYEEIFSMGKEQMERLKEDIVQKYQASTETFPECEDEDRDYLQLLAFICELSFDVYLKKQTMELLIDQIREEHPNAGKKRKQP